MTRAVVVALGLITCVAPALAQSPYVERVNRLNAFIRSRLEAQQPMHLAADTITMTGSTLRLSGHVRLAFDDGFLLADGAVIDQVTKQVELIGNTSAPAKWSGTSQSPARPQYK